MGHAELDKDMVDWSCWDGSENHLKKRENKQETEEIYYNLYILWLLYSVKLVKQTLCEEKIINLQSNAADKGCFRFS